MLLCLLVTGGHASASDWTEGGWFYLFNVDAERFLIGANAWGTQASIGLPSDVDKFQVNTLPNGYYQLKWGSKGNGVFIDSETYAYCDMYAQGHNDWQLTKQADGTYLISINPADATYGTAAKGNTYFGWDGSASTVVSPLLQQDGTNAGGAWMFLTETEYNELLVRIEMKDRLKLRVALAERYNLVVPSTVKEICTKSIALETLEDLNGAYREISSLIQEYADEYVSASNPMDVTEFVLHADASSFVGWTNVGGFVAMPSNGNYTNGSASVAYPAFEKWVWNASLSDATLSQEITGIPNGIYTLGADVIATRQTDQALSIEGANLFATGKEKKTTACSTANEKPQYFTVDFQVVNGTATVGFELASTNANWAAMDNFRLYYKGVDVTLLQETLEELIGQAEALNQDEMSAAVADRLNAALEVARNTEATKKALNAATQQLATAKNEAEAFVTAVTALKTLLATCNNVNENSIQLAEDAKNTFAVAIETASAWKNLADVAAVNAAIAALQTALQNYQLVAFPTNGLTFDLTYAVVNAKMDQGNTGWSTVDWGGVNGGDDNFQVMTNAGVSSDAYSGAFYERWRRNIAFKGEHQVYQTITNLPNGKYEVSLAAFCSPNGLMAVSANSDAVALEATGKMKRYTVEAFVLDNELTISLDALAGNTVSWCGLGDVSVTYYGRDLSFFTDRLNQVKTEAREYAASTQLSQAASALLTETVQEMQPAETTAESIETTLAQIGNIMKQVQAVATVYPTTKELLNGYKAVAGQFVASAAATAFQEALDVVETEVEASATVDALSKAMEGARTALCTYLPQGKPASETFDLTKLLRNPNFNNNTTEGWDNAASVTADEHVAEVFQNVFNMSQVLPGMPAGHYILKMQGFQRTADREAAETEYNNGTAVITASMYLNDTKQTLKNLFEDRSAVAYYPGEEWTADKATTDNKYVPNSMAGAFAYFAEGLYGNTLDYMLAADGDLTIGVENTEYRQNSWTLFDNFTLQYVPAEIKLDENSAAAPVAKDVYATKVTTNRTLKAGQWSTLCLPFDLSEAQVANAGITAVQTLSGITLDGETGFVTFAPAVGMEAGKPYLVKVAKNTQLSFSDVLVKAAAPEAVEVDGAIMQGSYHRVTLENAYYISGDKFYFADVPVPSKGFRASIVLMGAAAVKSLVIGVDNATGVEDAKSVADSEAPVDVYTLNGVRVKSGVSASQALNGLRKGVYIVNGKKVVK